MPMWKGQGCSGQDRGLLCASRPCAQQRQVDELAIQNKAAAYKIMRETNKVDTGIYCRSTLKDLISKLHDIDDGATAKKSGS
jgi:hypothetical protein